jgi:hypothetical protein
VRTVRDHELAIRPLEEEIGVTAREQPRVRRRSRGGAEGRLVSGEDPRLADRCPHRRQRTVERLERRDACPRADPGPPSEGLGRGRSVDTQVPARQLEAGVLRVDLGRRHGPDGRPPCPFPPDQQRAGRRGVPEAVRVLAEPAPRLPGAHPRAVEEGAQTSGEILRPPPALRVIGEGPEREDGEIARGHDEDVEPRAPELDQRWILPRGGFGPFDASVDRQERGPGHAVLQARPRRTPERPPPVREPLVEGADVSPEREDLLPREVKPRSGHITSPGRGTRRIKLYPCSRRWIQHRQNGCPAGSA